MKLDPSKKTFSDLTGLGQVAKSIPKEVYIRTADTVLNNFNDLIAPITETTSGFGRYIRQKFDNMVEVEKSLASYTLEKAIIKANTKASILGRDIRTPKHHKSFISSLEEASKETNEMLHLMWENILASQLVDYDFHPNYVRILKHFSFNEANVLLGLSTYEDIGDKDVISSYYTFNIDGFTHYVTKISEINNRIIWSYSCQLLIEFGLANVLGISQALIEPDDDNVTLLYRTKAGTNFLNTVSNK